MAEALQALRPVPALTVAMKSGTFSMLPISVNMRMTASLAPPCRGPYSAAAAAAVAE